MAERWVGIAVASDRVVCVDAEVSLSGPLVIQSDQSWKLQSGDRGPAYCVLHQQICDYLRENQIARVVIKASALSTGSTKLAHLTSAEVRGVVIAAAAAQCKVAVLAKAQISRTFGERKVDEYVKDDSFWAAQVSGNRLRAGSREAAMMLLAARKAK